MMMMMNAELLPVVVFSPVTGQINELTPGPRPLPLFPPPPRSGLSSAATPVSPTPAVVLIPSPGDKANLSGETAD